MNSHVRRRSITAGPFAIVALSAALLAAVPLRLELAKSDPVDKATVHAASEVRLWFTEAPMAMGPSSVTIQVRNAAGDPVGGGNAVQDARDAKAFSLALPAKLAPGTYAVTWRTMANDGQVMQGELGFTVAAH